MKKYLCGILIMLICSSTVACQSKQEISNVSSNSSSSNQISSTISSKVSSSTVSKAKTVSSSVTKMTDAKSVVDALKAKGLPINNIIVYTAKTDTNKLLGRPNQYTSKVAFADTRVEQSDKSDPVGGSVEVFNNQSDAKSRYDYINAIVKKGGSMFAQYLYLSGNVFLRIDGSLTPSQAKEYQSAFKEIMK